LCANHQNRCPLESRTPSRRRKSNKARNAVGLDLVRLRVSLTRKLKTGHTYPQGVANQREDRRAGPEAGASFAILAR
jgi:hypothetical protein